MPHIVIISDTHERHKNISVPDGDILIHCGDWTNQGSSFAMDSFLEWFVAMPHANKVFIAGNHELTLDSLRRKPALKIISEYTNNNIHYLENSSVVIDGLKIFGSPNTPFFFNWAFNKQRGKDIAAVWEKIPDDTNILITHGPSYRNLDLVVNSIDNMKRDLNQGCEDLTERIANLKELKMHCFGHIHNSYGQKINNEVIYVNASICTENYQPTNSPIEVDL